MTRPGDVRPVQLSEAPGERYRTPPLAPITARPRLGRAAAYGIGVTILVAALCALLRGILDLTTGLVAFAAAGGWAIGAVVRLGAWGTAPHRPSSAPVTLAMILGAACWLASLIGAWLVAMAILPGSSRTFPERLAATAFLDWLSPQLGLADFLGLGLFVTFAWVGARSTSVAEPGQPA